MIHENMDELFCRNEMHGGDSGHATTKAGNQPGMMPCRHCIESNKL